MKKHLHIKNLFLLILIVLILSGCKYEDIDTGEIKSVKIKQISSEKIDLKITLPLTNNNNYKIKIKDYQIKLKANGHILELAEPEEKIIIPANYNDLYTIIIGIKNKNLLSFNSLKIIYDLLSKKQLKVDICGYAKVKVFIFSYKINLNEKRIVKLNRNQ